MTVRVEDDSVAGDDRAPDRLLTAVEPAVVRVCIVNDYDVVVAGVSALLSSYADRVQVVEATTGLPAVGNIDVVLLDTFGRCDISAKLVDVLRASEARVIVYSWGPAPELTAGYVAVGAAGYLSKGATAAELVAAVEAVAGGTEPAAVWDTGDDDQPGSWPGQEHHLSSRESEVIALIVSGLSNQEVADRLYLSINSVKTYIRTAYRKMDVATRSQAVIWGMEHGFRHGRPAGMRHDGPDD